MEAARDKIIGRTLEIWQPRTRRKLTCEDGRQMVENIAGFFDILGEWEAKERKAGVKDFGEILSESGRAADIGEGVQDGVLPHKETGNMR